MTMTNRNVELPPIAMMWTLHAVHRESLSQLNARGSSQQRSHQKNVLLALLFDIASDYLHSSRLLTELNDFDLSDCAGEANRVQDASK